MAGYGNLIIISLGNHVKSNIIRKCITPSFAVDRRHRLPSAQRQNRVMSSPPNPYRCFFSKFDNERGIYINRTNALTTDNILKCVKFCGRTAVSPDGRGAVIKITASYTCV